MKKNLMLVMAWLLTVAAYGQDTYTTNVTVNSVIPDNNQNGLASGMVIQGLGGAITGVTVTLDITGGFNGDLYAYLAGPNGGFAVLLNRVGVGATSVNGYADSGFDVTLSDSAAYNIHTYQLEANPAGGALTGTWRPDGEAIDPQSPPSAFPTTPTAMLSSFNTLNANGTWTLFIADLSPGGQATLASFGVTVMTVPEPQTWVLGFIGGAAGLIAGQRLRRKRL